MSICINTKRKQYFICYKITLEDGKQKTMTITNANWKTNLVGKKYMQSIEEEEIEKDKKKRKLRVKKKDGSLATLEDVLYDYIVYQYNYVKKTTAYQKECKIKKHISSFFKTDKPVCEALTISTINNFVRNLSSNTELTKSSCNMIITLLKGIIQYGMKIENIPYEYGNKLLLHLDPLTEKNEIEEEKIKVLNEEELKIFFNSFSPDDKYYYLFDLLYKGALRIGECLALQWKDLDVENKRIYVYKSYSVLAEITTTKSKSSKDYVYLPKSCIDNLLKLKEMTYANDDDYMFFARKKPISRKVVTNKLKAMLSKLDIPKISLHGFRHSCATTMIYKGVQIQDISHHLRHKDIGVTLRTYVHWLPNNMQKQLDEIF